MRNLKAKRIVIKIGTNVVSDSRGTLDLGIMRKLVEQIVKIKNHRELVIITSGAIGAGIGELKLISRPADVTMRQVCAAVGQNILMAKYHSMFSRHKIKIAQILLTYKDFSDKKTYKNLHNSLTKMLNLGVIPIINENDPISIDEIGPSFGDNDTLSALIAAKIKADLLVILTNVDGLFTKDPNHKGAMLIKDVRKINKKIEAMAGASSQLGIGGMKTKINAAKIATGKGTATIIANGRTKDVLIKIINNQDVGTIFHA
jgi:glutamate 5-kinase